MTRLARPQPCPECPYRTDAPSGLWAPDHFDLLPPYDNDTGAQPIALFMCHHSNLDEPEQLCGGWVRVHGWQLLALRLAAASDTIDPGQIDGVLDSPCAAELHPTGAAAAEAGTADADNPSQRARRAALRLTRARARNQGGHTTCHPPTP